MSLLDRHEKMLANSLEKTKYFGRSITFTSEDDSITYDLNGSVNIISTHISNELDNVTAKRSNCTVRFSSLAVACGYDEDNPTDETWKDNLPQPGWTVETTKTSLNLPVFCTIEPGSYYPDEHLPMVTYFLADLEVVEE